MQKYIAYVVGAFVFTIAVSLAAPEKDEFIAREQAVWNAFKDKNADQVKKLLSTDVVAVYPDGIYNFQQRLESMQKIEMKSFSLSDFNVVRPAGDVVVISYKAKVEGKDGWSELNCGTVWNSEKRRMESGLSCGYEEE